MKTKNILKVAFVSAIAFTSIETYAVNNNTEITSVKHDDKVTKTFKVYGNCGMCEKTIEGAFKGVKGIEKADWNKETKIMEVTFDESVITLKEIKQKIADVGYDTDEVRASEKVYNKLPGCCQYERPESTHEDHKH